MKLIRNSVRRLVLERKDQDLIQELEEPAHRNNYVVLAMPLAVSHISVLGLMAIAHALTRLDKDKAAVRLVDQQAGLLSLVRDIDPDKFKNNVLAVADLAKYFKLPTILTTSFEGGPNGPLVPQLKQAFPDAPFIPRPGQINAWDNEDFVKAVKGTK